MADFRELRLTSPHMRGREVELAQHRLHNNRYGEFYKPSHTDGVYGPETAAATKHAKYARLADQPAIRHRARPTSVR